MRLTPALLMAVALLAATALAVVQPIAVRQTGLQLAQEQAAASRCSSACAGRGTCNEELGRCDCTRGYTGDDCRTPPGDLAKLCSSLYFREPLGGNCMHEPGSGHCINACNARGVCLAGFCLCDAGFYGADCSLSLDASGRPALLAGTGYTPRARRPHVYIYELPPRYTTWLNMMGSDRPLTFMLHQRLLSSGARVADGETADWYLIPINMRGPGDSVKLQKAIKYIQSKWPWWDRHHGGRHVLVHVGDPGRGDVTGKVKLLTENCTYLHHWGLHRDFKLSGWKAAHRPGRDVVVPIYIGPHSGRGRIFSHSPLHPRSPEQRAAGGPAAKTLEMLFAGRICGGTEEPQPELGKGSCPRGINRGYSQGVRQAVHLYHWNRSGFSVSTKNADYQADLRRARFCLAPTGGGHGHRQILVAFAGCVPLLIGDYVYQPFEPELDWGRFSVSVRQVDIPDLHTRLAGIDAHAYTDLQAALACAAEHLTWSSIIGGFKWDTGKYDAFETTLEILRSMLAHPGVPPERLREVDAELAAFMECRSGGGGRGGDAPQAATVPSAPQDMVCSLSKFDEEATRDPCSGCVSRSTGVVPGGMACCGAASLGRCPRLWD